MFINKPTRVRLLLTPQQKTSPHLKPLQNIVSQQLDLEPEEVTPPKEFVADLGADSLDVVEIVLGVEEHFEITLAEEDVETMITVADMVAYLDENVEGGDDDFLQSSASRFSGIA